MVCKIVSSLTRILITSIIDPFLPSELDPLRTQALDSSLWEILSHTIHYHAPVSTMCKIFSEAFTKPGYLMEDFLDHTYHTVCRPLSSFALTVPYLLQLFATEINRKVKQEPALAVQSKIKIFPDRQDQELMKKREVDSNDIVGEFWTFG